MFFNYFLDHRRAFVLFDVHRPMVFNGFIDSLTRLQSFTKYAQMRSLSSPLQAFGPQAFRSNLVVLVVQSSLHSFPLADYFFCGNLLHFFWPRYWRTTATTVPTPRVVVQCSPQITIALGNIVGSFWVWNYYGWDYWSVVIRPVPFCLMYCHVCWGMGVFYFLYQWSGQEKYKLLRQSLTINDARLQFLVHLIDRRSIRLEWLITKLSEWSMIAALWT